MHNPPADRDRIIEPEDNPPVVHRPGLVVVLVLTALGCGSALALWMQRPGDAPYIGVLQTASQTVTAGRAARIAQILVDEGQQVEAGEPLFVLSDAQLDNARAGALRKVEQLEAELSQAQARAVVELEWRLDELDQDLFDAKLKSARCLQDKLAHEVSRIAHQELINRLDKAEREGSAIGQIRQIGQDKSDPVDNQARMDVLLKVHEAENSIEVAQAQIEMCDRRVKELEKLKAELPEKVRLSMGIHVVEARLAEARDRLERLQESKADLTLRAAQHGTIGIINRQAGDSVSAEAPLVEILDNEHQFLAVNIPSTDIDKFAVGNEIDLEFPNGVHREGRVVKTAAHAITPEGNPSTGGVTTIPVHIEPAGKLWPAVPFRTTIKVRPRD